MFSQVYYQTKQFISQNTFIHAREKAFPKAEAISEAM